MVPWPSQLVCSSPDDCGASSRPGSTCPFRSGRLPSTPESMTASVMPLPVLVRHIWSAFMFVRYRCCSRMVAAWAGAAVMPTSSSKPTAPETTHPRQPFLNVSAGIRFLLTAPDPLGPWGQGEVDDGYRGLANVPRRDLRPAQETRRRRVRQRQAGLARGETPPVHGPDLRRAHQRRAEENGARSHAPQIAATPTPKPTWQSSAWSTTAPREGRPTDAPAPELVHVRTTAC